MWGKVCKGDQEIKSHLRTNYTALICGKRIIAMPSEVNPSDKHRILRVIPNPRSGRPSLEARLHRNFTQIGLSCLWMLMAAVSGLRIPHA